MITYTTTNMQNYIDATNRINELNRQAKHAQITTSDDPRIAAAAAANAALIALSDTEIDMIETITGWTI